MTGADPLEELLQTSRWQRGVERRLAERRKATQHGEAFERQKAGDDRRAFGTGVLRQAEDGTVTHVPLSEYFDPHAGDPDHDASAWRAYVEGGNDY